MGFHNISQVKNSKMGNNNSTTEKNSIFKFSIEEINISSLALGIVLTIIWCILMESFCPAAVQNVLSTCCCHQTGQRQEPPVVPLVHQRHTPPAFSPSLTCRHHLPPGKQLNFQLLLTIMRRLTSPNVVFWIIYHE